MIRLTQGQVEAEARRVVHAAFLNLRQRGRPVDVRLTHTRSIEVGTVQNHQSFHGVSFASRELSKCFAGDEQRHGARSVTRMRAAQSSGEMKAKCLLLTLAAAACQVERTGAASWAADADAGSLDLKITYSGLEFAGPDRQRRIPARRILAAGARTFY